MPFFSRALFSTVDQLKKLSIPVENEHQNECLVKRVHTLFHLKQYYSLYKYLSCSNMKIEDTYHFCRCCNEYNNFMRNYSFYLHLNLVESDSHEENHSGIDPLEGTNDAFIFYICALTQKEKMKKENYLFMALKKNKLFYDAIKELLPILTDTVSLLQIYNEEENTHFEQTFFEFFKLRYYIDFYADLGISENKIIQVDKKKDIRESNLKKKEFLKKTVNLCSTTRTKKINERISGSQIQEKSFMSDGSILQDMSIPNENQSIKGTKIDVINLIKNIQYEHAPQINENPNEQDLKKNENGKENTFLNANPIMNTEKDCISSECSKFLFRNDENMSSYTKSYLNNLKAAYYYTIKNYEKSILLFNNTKCLDFLDFLSHILYINHDIKGASILASYLNNINPFGSESLISMGNYHSLCKNRESAIDCFKRALKYHTSLVFLNNLIGHEYLDGENINSALEYFKYCNDYRSYFGMGQCYLKLNLFSLSIEMFKRSTRLNENNLFAWHFLGDTYRKISDYKNAINSFAEMVLLGDPSGLLLIGEVYKDKRDYEKAVKYFEAYSQFVDDNRIKGFLEEYYSRVGRK